VRNVAQPNETRVGVLRGSSSFRCTFSTDRFCIPSLLVFFRAADTAGDGA
jgi:hypothetical protein